MDVTAADIASTNPSWWIANGTTNPGSGSYWTFYYFQNGAFSKMGHQEGEKGAFLWRPAAATDPECINGWSHTGSSSRYVAVGFTAASSGTVTGTAFNPIYTDANGAQIMAVLQNAETGKFYPVYPTAGKWEWKTLSGTKDGPDVGKANTLFTVDYKANDIIYFVTRPVGENATGYSTLLPAVSLTEGAANNYPATSKFTPWGVSVPESTTATTSWYGGQNQNPWPGSPFTFAYLNNSTKVISTMENFKTNHWESASAKAHAGTWYTNTSDAESAVITYTASKAGTVAITDNNKLKVTTGSGEYMIVQESVDGGFCPIYPTKGVWETKALTTGETAVNVNTYVKAGDKLHLVYKSADGTWTQISTVPSVTFTPYDTDSGSLRPASGSFGQWDPPKSTTSSTSWYAQQNQNPWPGSPFTFAYLNNSTKVISTMEKFKTDHWESASAKAWAGSWYTNNTDSESAVITYTASKAGTIAIADNNKLKVITGSGEYMIVQESVDGGFCPIYPTKGVWETKALSTGETAVNVNTYVKAGDKLHLVYKSADGTWTQISTVPSVTFTPYDTDSGSLRPANDDFKAWDVREGVQLAAVFGDNMILQRNKPVQIFGHGVNEGDTVTVNFAGQTKTATISGTTWSVTLDAMAANTVGQTLTVTHTVNGGNSPKSISIKNVLVGEVWFCAGQSNMAVSIYDVRSRYPEMAALYDNAANLSSLRVYTQPVVSSATPLTEGDDSVKWETPKAGAIDKYSAIALGYAIQLQSALGSNVPVGVIVSAKGGTFIEEWLDADTMSTLNVVNDTAAPLKSKLYNGMIHHFKGTTVAGLLWYQGENNAANPELYASQFKAYAKLYRNLFSNSTMPIISFQLVQYNNDKWPAFRQMQWELMDSVSNMYVVSGIDLGNPDDIHPGDKYVFSGRAAGIARKYIYGTAAVSGKSYGLSPYPTLIETKDNTLVIHLSDATALTCDSTEIDGFLARKKNSEDWYALKGTIQGNTIVLTGDTADVVAVKYLQAANFSGTKFVYNEYGLPVAPFADFGIDGQEAPPLPAPKEKSNTSWYAQQVNNPWSGSPWTFSYLNAATSVFTKLEKHVPKTDSTEAHWSSTSGDAKVGPFFAHSSTKEAAALIYRTGRAGLATVTDMQKLRSLSGVGGYMILQQNGDGKFYPLYPVKGEWKFLRLTEEDHTTEVTTYLNANDRLFIVYLTDDANAQVCSTPQVIFQAAATDEDALRAQDGSFTQWQTPTAHFDVATTNVTWYVKQNKNPWPGSPFTFAYYKVNETTQKPMTKYQNKDDGFADSLWKSPSEKAWLSAWYANCSGTEDAAVIYTPEEAVRVTVSDMFGPIVKGKYKGQFAIVQQNSKGQYYPIYPKKGAWEFKTLSDTNPELSVDTYLAQGDKLIMVYASANGQWAQIESATQISYYACDNDQDNLRPDDSQFKAWGFKRSPAEQNSFTHSAYFTSTSPVNGRFSYEFGFNGDFSLMTKYFADWKCWRNGDAPPSVASYYIGSTNNHDGVIAYTAKEDTDIRITSTLPIKLDPYNASKSDGAAFMIVQQSGNGFYPLWPQKGDFEWAIIDSKTEPFQLPDLTTRVKNGDRILFITRCIGGNVGDVIIIDPSIKLLSTKKIAHPQFTEWKHKPIQIPDPIDGAYKHSTYFSTDSSVNGPFSYLYGTEGMYKRMEMYRTDYNAWAKIGGGSAVGSYWLSGTNGNDAVVAFTAPKAGLATISSNKPITLTFPNQSDGAALAIILRNENGEHPIWPEKGQWEFKEINGEMELDLQGISEYLQAGDQLLFVAYSLGNETYDSINFDPIVTMDYEAEDPGVILPNVPRVKKSQDEAVKELPIMDGISIAPPANENAGDGANNLWIVYAIAAGVIVIAGILVVIISQKRKKK